MGKYIKIAKVVEAEQYTEYGKLVKGICTSKGCIISGDFNPHVHTIHNNQLVNVKVGDFIIPEPDGVHFYPVKPDIFESTYRPVNDSYAHIYCETTDEDIEHLKCQYIALHKAMNEIHECYKTEGMPLSKKVLEIVKRFVKITI